MKKKIKIIDLLCLISVGEEVPNKIKHCDNVYRKCDIGDDYFNDASYDWLFKDVFDTSMLNDEVEILDDEEDKDIPLIPDDELWYISGKKGIIEDAYTYSKISRDNAINHNFKVLKEKINQLVEEFNEYRKGE